MNHRITIPGLDYDKCGQCGQYLIRDVECDRLEKLIAHALAKNRGKEAATMTEILSTEKQRRLAPCQPTPYQSLENNENLSKGIEKNSKFLDNIKLRAKK